MDHFKARQEEEMVIFLGDLIMNWLVISVKTKDSSKITQIFKKVFQ